ncbi:MAG: MarR family transcriptional regulator [Coriobacteriia bacterium]|nr:MarR family transcriptional regulator [Coriobacteriia bacterium]
MTTSTVHEKDRITPEYLQSQGERAELIQSNILAWRRMYVALQRRSKLRFHRGDSMVKYDPVVGKGKILARLAQEDGQTQADLSRELGIRPQSLGPQLKQMEADGLVAKSKSSTDKRVLHVHLTPKGLAAAQALREEQRFSGSMFEIYSKEELETLLPLVTKLAVRLEAEYEAATSYDQLTSTPAADEPTDSD